MELYLCLQAKEIPGIKIFRCDASLYYANTEFFMNKLYSRTGVNPRKLKLAINKVQKKRDQERTKRSKKLVKMRNNKVGTCFWKNPRENLLSCSLFVYHT